MERRHPFQPRGSGQLAALLADSVVSTATCFAAIGNNGGKLKKEVTEEEQSLSLVRAGPPK